MTQERTFAGDVDATRDARKAAASLSPDEERVARKRGESEEDKAEARRAAALAAASDQNGFT